MNDLIIKQTHALIQAGEIAEAEANLVVIAEQEGDHALVEVRRRGWAQSVGEREPGVASVSAPVRSPSGRVIAAASNVLSPGISRTARRFFPF